jgi:hypothetical protein
MAPDKRNRDVKTQEEQNLAAVRQMSRAELLTLGVDQIGYLKPLSSADAQEFMHFIDLNATQSDVQLLGGTASGMAKGRNSRASASKSASTKQHPPATAVRLFAVYGADGRIIATCDNEHDALASLYDQDLQPVWCH